MISYVIKEKGQIVVKQFDVVDSVAQGVTADMLLDRDEIVYDIVNNRLSEDDKAYFRSATKEDLIMEHLGFGMWIRNTYGLWEVMTNPLVEPEADPDSLKHPDNLSGEIMELVSQTLRGEYTPEVTFVKEHFDDAMKILGDA